MIFLFPGNLRGFLPDAVPLSLASQGSSSRGLTSPSEYLHSNLSEDASNLEQLPWGLGPLRDNSTMSPLTGEHPKPTYVPPSAFLTLPMVSSSPCAVSLFHPTAAYGIRLSGVFPTIQPHRLIIAAYPHDVSRRSPVNDESLTPDFSAAPSGFCSKPRSVATTKVFSPCCARSPRRLVLLRAFLYSPWSAFQQLLRS